MKGMVIEQQMLVKELTPYGRQVIDLLSNGPDKKQIAEELAGMPAWEMLALGLLKNGLKNERIVEELINAVCTIKLLCRQFNEESADSDSNQEAVLRAYNIYYKVVSLQMLHLTDQEKRVLGLLKGGPTNQQMADSLSVSRNTVKAHMSSILSKLGVADRTQAALWAVYNLDYYLELEALEKAA